MHDIVSILGPHIQFTSFHQIHTLAQPISITYYPLKNQQIQPSLEQHTFMCGWLVDSS